MNKIDLTEFSAHFDIEHNDLPARVWLSSLTGEGLDVLCKQLANVFSRDIYKGRLCLHPALARFRANLYEHDAVLSEVISDRGEYLLDISIQSYRLDLMLEKEELTLSQLEE